MYHTDLSEDDVTIICTVVNALFKYLESKPELFSSVSFVSQPVVFCVSFSNRFLPIILLIQKSTFSFEASMDSMSSSFTNDVVISPMYTVRTIY